MKTGHGPERSWSRDTAGSAASVTAVARSAGTPQVVGPCANVAKKRHIDRQRCVSIPALR
jgi:hypothetical protein